MGYETSEDKYHSVYIVPSSVLNVSVSIVNDSLIILWEEPVQPNDFTWNYTVTITNNTTGSQLNKTVLNMSITHLDTSTDPFGKHKTMCVCGIVA